MKECRHVAIIMDGNGRWAKAKGMPRTAGHKVGADNVRTIAIAANELGVKYLTLYAFSTENWKRSNDEVNYLMKLPAYLFKMYMKEFLERGFRIRLIGDLSALPEATRKVLLDAADESKDNTGLSLIIAINYGSRDEIRRAVKSIAEKVKAGELEPEEIEDLTMTEFELEMPQNIRSEETESMADLTKTILEADYEVCTCPRIDASTYLTAKVKTAELPNLLTNSAKVYLSGMYMGTVVLNQDYSEEFETVSLGKEERIRVITKEVSKKTSKTLLKAQNVTEYVYETTIMNTLGREVTVLVKDQIPVSANKAVTVDLIKADGYQKEEETGFLKQTVTIPAGGSKILTLSYKVSWPKDKVLKESASAGYPKFCPECGSVLSSRTCSTCGWTAN